MASGFDWDRHNVSHIGRHGITPVEAEEVIQNDPFEQEGTMRGGEQRTVNIGVTDAGRFLLVVTTWREGKMRIVTAYPANRKQVEACRRWRSGEQA